MDAMGVVKDACTVVPTVLVTAAAVLAIGALVGFVLGAALNDLTGRPLRRSAC